MKEIILKFISPTLNDSNHRYKSWVHCFNAFKNKNESTDLLALHLGFYLASWGMYRGSSGLLWKDYKVHCEAIDIIKVHYSLRIEKFSTQPEIQDVLKLVKGLTDYYSIIDYTKEKEIKSISATDTLISKIILGTLGCLPAFDRYFNLGLGLYKNGYFKINEKNLGFIWEKVNELKPQIEPVQSWIIQKTGVWYPPMKIIDMYYWQIGFENEDKVKKSGVIIDID